MKTVRQFASLVLLAALFGYPAMACLIPGADMTETERECCKHMSQQCGSMDMPSSHSCCEKEVGRPSSMLRVAVVHFVPPAVYGAIVSELQQPHLAEAQASFFELHPPPESPPGSSSILRI